MNLTRLRLILCALTLLAAACGAVQADSDADPGDEPDGGTPTSCAEDPCDTSATCDDGSGAVVCTCNAGYTGDGFDCDDVNECQTDNGGCHDLANCINQPGTRACVCPTGHVGDGINDCTPIWSNVQTWDVGPGDWFHVAAHGTRAYLVGRETASDQFFKSIDVVTGTEQTHTNAPMDDFNGNYQPLVTIGNRIYYFYQYAQYFDVTTATWGSLTYPYERQRYDAAIAAISNVIFLVGGQGTDPVTGSWYQYNSTTFGFNLATGATGGWGDYAAFPLAVSSARAASLDGRIYVAGGQTSAGGDNLEFYAYSPNTWLALPDLPEMYVRDISGFDGKVWALYSDHIRTFDSATNTWDAAQINVPSGVDAWQARLLEIDGALHLVHRDGTAMRFWRYNL